MTVRDGKERVDASGWGCERKTCDFRRIQVLDADTRRSIEQIVRWPLFGVSRSPAHRSYDFKDRVQAHHVVRKHRLAYPIYQPPGHFVRVNAAAAIKWSGIDALFQIDHRARSAGAMYVCRSKPGPVVSVVIIHPTDGRRSTS